ncbi:hypothetical protein ES677_08725 [Bizionia gelidisalsuginis]|uniref:DUF4595 domain-containing protein n=2 Tax=Bizionia TaxID=283785 RepID=A0A8H2LEK1_9FLAO|nr:MULTISPECIES: hypothetical protein [Bizionia]TYB77964.1 hypothetical protein ES676_01735 [Bizionia saleffrena]TYC12733.1 hypothetical protein ES677_08725 [Bizionia gelidisalsuginis]
MKKILFLLSFSIAFTSCNNEPLDPDFAIGTEDPTIPVDPGTGSDDLTLATYSYNVAAQVPLFGTINTDSNFTFTNGKASGITTVTTFFGVTSTTQTTIITNALGNVTALQSYEGSTLTNETIITYDGQNISQIVYNFIEDDADDYTYTFTYNGNIVTRTDADNGLTTTFEFDGNTNLIRKETFEDSLSIQAETLTYTTGGNCAESIMTGETNTTSTYAYDTATNPLKQGFINQYMLSFLNDDYDAQAGSIVAQFHGANNWIATTTAEGTFEFTINYIATDRISTKNSFYDLGEDTTVTQSEVFNYIN